MCANDDGYSPPLGTSTSLLHSPPPRGPPLLDRLPYRAFAFTTAFIVPNTGTEWVTQAGDHGHSVTGRFTGMGDVYSPSSILKNENARRQVPHRFSFLRMGLADRETR